ncbi:CMP-N-acetylneuraminate-beta-1,4-galactoside alpha-2,3-sialyltransferase-like isoform 5-T13 [Spinachia spinachia]
MELTPLSISTTGSRYCVRRCLCCGRKSRGDALDGAMLMTDDHEANSQADVHPVPHAGARLYLLLFWEATSTRMGPEASFMKPAPMFLDRNFKRLAKVSNYLPPFGFKTQERVIDSILSATKKFGLGEALDSLSCKRCIIVGNGGILFNKSLGSRIDDYDVIVRLNEAPVRGYGKDVGTKTTIRITYPEGAIQKPDNYEKDSLFVFSAFKPLDLKWLRQMVFKEKLRGTEGFWKSVARYVPRDPTEMRILNPYFIQEAAFQFIGLPFNNGLMGKGNIPTLGTVAITMALHNCDEVAVAGFGYDMKKPHAPLHYYESVKMSAIKESWTHNISKEKEFLRKLVKANIITDLTNGI